MYEFYHLLLPLLRLLIEMESQESMAEWDIYQVVFFYLGDEQTVVRRLKWYMLGFVPCFVFIQLEADTDKQLENCYWLCWKNPR